MAVYQELGPGEEIKAGDEVWICDDWFPVEEAAVGFSASNEGDLIGTEVNGGFKFRRKIDNNNLVVVSLPKEDLWK